MNKEISKQLVDATARLETIIHLGAMATDTCSLPNALEELIEESTFKEIEELFGMPAGEALDCHLDHREEMLREAIVEHLHVYGRLGFLVQIATPVMKRQAQGRSFSWGYFQTKWVYAETLEDAIDAGLKWVAERRAKENAEFEKKQAEVSHG